MPQKKCPPAGAPEWVLTYGDMMSLLLTFFIMLFAMSSLEKTKTAAVVESFSSQFGYANTQVPTPGAQTPANSNKSQIRSTGRARRNDTLRGGNPVLSPQGDYAKVRSIRPSRDQVVGGIIYFDLGSDELTDQAKQELRQVADQLRGSPYKVMIKGHTSNEQGIYTNNLYALGFSRAMKAREELIRLGVNGKLLQVTSVGPDEPMPDALRTPGVGAQQANACVEIVRLLEHAKDFEGDRREREAGN